MNNDLISREALLDEFETKCERFCSNCEYRKWNTKLYRYECELINTAPTVTPEKALIDKLKGGAENDT